MATFHPQERVALPQSVARVLAGVEEGGYSPSVKSLGVMCATTLENFAIRAFDADAARMRFRTGETLCQAHPQTGTGCRHPRTTPGEAATPTGA